MPQNRPYPTDQGPLMVKATFTSKDGVQTSTVFDWNKREDVRTFAARSDINLRAGGSTLLGQLTNDTLYEACPKCGGATTYIGRNARICFREACSHTFEAKLVQQTKPPSAWFPSSLLQQPLDIK